MAALGARIILERQALWDTMQAVGMSQPVVYMVSDADDDTYPALVPVKFEEVEDVFEDDDMEDDSGSGTEQYSD